MASSFCTTAATEPNSQRIAQLCKQLEFFANQQVQHIQPLSHGQSNQSYHIITDRAEYVLRSYPAQHKQCRQQELTIQHAAAVHGLAPAPLCLNNHQQIMISDFVSGGEAFNYQRHDTKQLITHIATLHKLKVMTSVLQLEDYLQLLVDKVQGNSQLDISLVNQLFIAAKQLMTLPADTVLCHLDLHADNLLWADNRLWLLDFEYSQQADSSLDLAALSLHYQLNTQQEQQLLTAYAQQRNQANLEQGLTIKIPLAKQLYSGFCWLWYLANPSYSAQASHWLKLIKK
ncbi:phosphotransferase [Rheinheimera sp. WS51]|uniref:phosphotransferase n=1 Tax=Rheinheimera sp. WS51 TaxID=3425886 RepID=UPI003D9143DB